jgi:Amt family ammonium transporter
VNLATGRADGVEALVRWEHPVDGVIMPSDFIPIAEETGLVVPLGEWVLGEACRQAQAWRTEHPELADLHVSVNLSGRQIAQSDLVTVVANVLATTGLPPGSLVLEITESVLMADAEYALTMLRGLKNLGVRLSIDDFGTGYSSLSYLKKFPVDILKIDRSFIDGLGVEGDDTAIVQATITVAHSLGLTTVAEGAETPVQVKALIDLGCDKAQGYLFSRPQPAAALTETLVRGWSPSPSGTHRLVPPGVGAAA